jgi:hypothetical protein
MTFKEFIHLTEAFGATGGDDTGLMGYGVPPTTRKPSDGQPFAQFLGPTAGSKGAAAGAIAGGAAKMMKKRMKKR